MNISTEELHQRIEAARKLRQAVAVLGYDDCVALLESLRNPRCRQESKTAGIRECTAPVFELSPDVF